MKSRSLMMVLGIATLKKIDRQTALDIEEKYKVVGVPLFGEFVATGEYLSLGCA